MRNLLEKAIVHLLNGDDEKASALFHKFMVERARQIHESLRTDGAEDTLDENWDSEITEEEYFDDDELSDDDNDDAMAPAGDADGSESPIHGGDDDEDLAPGDDLDTPDMDDDLGGDSEGEGGLEGKIDDLTDKIDELTAEFDRAMAQFGGDDDDGDIGLGGDDDTGFGDDGDAGSDVTADISDDDGMDGADAGGDLAGRMTDDMGDEDDDDDMSHAEFAEGRKPAFMTKSKEKSPLEQKQKKKHNVDEASLLASDADDKDDEDPTDSGRVSSGGTEDPEEDNLDESLKDITESVLDELDKISAVPNSEHKGVGANTAKNNITAGPNDSPLPHHNVNDRVGGKPVMTKGPEYKSHEREQAPNVKPGSDLVKDVRVGNRRKSYSDTMKEVPAEGDKSALVNKDFAAGGPKATQSIIDGKKKKG